MVQGNFIKIQTLCLHWAQRFQLNCDRIFLCKINNSVQKIFIVYSHTESNQYGIVLFFVWKNRIFLKLSMIERHQGLEIIMPGFDKEVISSVNMAD